MLPSVLAKGDGSKAMGADAIQVAMQRGNINIGANQPKMVLELSEASVQAQQKHAEVLRRYEAQQRARSVIVPTAVEDVKAQLRALGHPITLFGENHADRRVRLQEVIAEMELDATEISQLQDVMNRVGSVSTAAAVPTSPPERPKETVYTEASEALVEARRFMAEFSFTRSRDRLQKLKQLRANDELARQNDEALAALYKHNKEIALNGTQFGDERPLTCIRYSPDGTRLAAGSLSAYVQFFNAKTLDNIGSLRGHTQRISKLNWHPEAVENNPTPLIATASADTKAMLWNAADGTMIHTFTGHKSSISGIDFHPSGRVLGTVSHDTTMRLWDVEAGAELLLQDGHIVECGCIAFQPDGALVLTGDYSGIIHIWDLRSGQSVCPLQGHVKKVITAHFSPNSWQVATGSDDNVARIWDLRMKKTSYVLPAHSNVISDVRFSSSGELLLTSAFDGLLKVWGTRDFSLLRTLSGHTGRVMACDISVDERHFASAGYDRTVKLWAHKNEF